MNSAIDPATLLPLQHKRIYFGHQSVGANIMDGVRDLCRADTGLHLGLVESSQAEAYAAPVLGHSRIGPSLFHTVRKLGGWPVRHLPEAMHCCWTRWLPLPHDPRT